MIKEFKDFKKPKIVALVTGNGSGSKVFQALLDGHPEIYMIPAYPLMYFYPHWNDWQKDLQKNWCWKSIIEIFCKKHASILDTRKIPGFNGMTQLGNNKNEHLEINEYKFKKYLNHVLEKELISSSTFILAVHYIYAILNRENIDNKKILLYHIHDIEFLKDYMLKDFPDLKIIGMTRDPRNNLEKRYTGSFLNVDKAKLNLTDQIIYRGRPYLFANDQIYNGIEKLKCVRQKNTFLLRHEDLVINLEKKMKLVSRILDISFTDSLLSVTFGGKIWWGDKIYGRKLTNIVNPKIMDEEWRNKLNAIELYVREGVLFDKFIDYDYDLYLYKSDNLVNRLVLLLLIIFPTKIELLNLLHYIKPKIHIFFLKKTLEEFNTNNMSSDYYENATFRYKKAYSDLKLYKLKATDQLRNFIFKLKNKNSFLYKYLLFPIKITYIFLRYAKFLFQVLISPLNIFKRIATHYVCLFRRLLKLNFKPTLI